MLTTVHTVHTDTLSDRGKQTSQFQRDEETRQDEDLCDRGYRRNGGRQFLC